ncbi:MAG: YdeI/OmpD-associated family protein [Flavobacteriales bacterium]|nr:YdeI/OmpD-associated family protein [Flavobacteriales bacterium]
MNTTPEVNAYIGRSQDFAKPVLSYLRELILNSHPGISEKIKWQFPVFIYKNKNMCYLGAFKNHCSLGFWYSTLLSDPQNLLLVNEEKNGMGNFGKFTSIEHLPSKENILDFIFQSMALIDKNVKLPKKENTPKDLEIPDYFANFLKANVPASIHFNKLSPSHKKEYIEWIVDAKTEKTRTKRMSQSIEWLAKGKNRNWKYE